MHGSERAICIAIFILAALVIALYAGVAMRASGANVPAVLTAGGASSVAVIGLGIGVSQFLNG